ncbi:hypothetical protein, partial [Actinoallomurus acaciae]
MTPRTVRAARAIPGAARRSSVLPAPTGCGARSPTRFNRPIPTGRRHMSASPHRATWTPREPAASKRVWVESIVPQGVACAVLFGRVGGPCRPVTVGGAVREPA